MPVLTTALKLKERTFETRTYQLSEDKIEGFVDGLEALKQAIYKVLATEQFEYPIYSFSYGIAWKELVGEEAAYVRPEMRRMIEEALIRDDRILEVDGFEFEFIEDICRCSFHVQSIYGEIDITKEVQI